MKPKLLTHFFYLSVMALNANGQVHIENLARSIVYIVAEHPVFEDVTTNHFEVFYHLPGETNFIRKVQQMSGTGFLVSHHGSPYIVTAKHVAGEASNSGTVY